MSDRRTQNQGSSDDGAAPEAGSPVGEDAHAGEAHLPAPSIWPAVCAFGMTLLAFGVVTGLAFSALGAVLLAVGVGGWIGELRRE